MSICSCWASSRRRTASTFLRHCSSAGTTSSFGACAIAFGTIVRARLRPSVAQLPETAVLAVEALAAFAPVFADPLLKEHDASDDRGRGFALGVRGPGVVDADALSRRLFRRVSHGLAPELGRYVPFVYLHGAIARRRLIGALLLLGRENLAVECPHDAVHAAVLRG